jgi:hypothetical protein
LKDGFIIEVAPERRHHSRRQLRMDLR